MGQFVTQRALFAAVLLVVAYLVAPPMHTPDPKGCPPRVAADGPLPCRRAVPPGARVGALAPSRSFSARDEAVSIYAVFAVLLLGAALLPSTPDPSERVALGGR